MILRVLDPLLLLVGRLALICIFPSCPFVVHAEEVVTAQVGIPHNCTRITACALLCMGAHPAPGTAELSTFADALLASRYYA